MLALRAIPLMLAALVLGAHFLRADQVGLTAACIVFPAILMIRSRWVLRTIRIMALLAAAWWLLVTYTIFRVRLATDQPWLRMVLIMLAVAALTALVGRLFRSPQVQAHYPDRAHAAGQSVAVFFLVWGTLNLGQFLAGPLLILGRLSPWLPGIEVLLLAILAAWWIEHQALKRSLNPHIQENEQ